MKQQISRRILSLRIVGQHQLAAVVIERREVDAVFHRTNTSMGGRQKQEVSAIWKEHWPAMRRVPGGVHFRGLGGDVPPGSIYSQESAAILRGVNDHVVLAPGASARIRPSRQRDHWASACGNLAEFAGAEKTYKPAIRRPEWTVSSLRPRQLLDGPVKVPHPDHVLL